LLGAEPAAGVAGLPPPRSAAVEQMRRQQQYQQQWQPATGGSGRVKVFMPQQYNSPMGMYSAHNVLETFTAQAESMLDTLERYNNNNNNNNLICKAPACQKTSVALLRPGA